MTTANFLPEHNGELHQFEIVYRDERYHTSFHLINSKSIPNALKSFERAVPRHGKILKVRLKGAK